MKITRAAEFERLAALETPECVVWPHAVIPRGGYGYFKRDGSTVLCHREALRRRRPPESEALHAVHGPCHNPACMNYRHLSWGTAVDNAADRYRDGTHAQGEYNPAARLTEEDVLEIRRMLKSGWSQRRLAKRFAVSQGAISMIRRKRNWGWL